ncbi:protoporphyrinogen oxidase [Cytophaga aurantiaca]|uniref:protoporphyrinogen oxidase n=1 Tax=Cytophaga aurantiaca TaxID=29530 RepID=UPI000361B42D|nr:protoporphyrinogen oxidase [Cytophaga aurantiaca]
MIVIIGAGISGLTLAYELEKAKKPYILLESSSRTGGYINSVKVNEYLLEVGPNSILIDAAFDVFLNELNLSSSIEDAALVNKNRFIYKNGRVQQVPSGPLSFLFSSFFSFQTKRTIFKEIFNTSKTVENESVYDFFTRRFSKEFTQYTIDPFATGVYAGDIKQLLIEETFPSLVALEKEYGSIIKGVFKKGFGSRRRTASLKGGLQTLTNTLASRISNLSLQTKVVSVSKHEAGLSIAIQKNGASIENMIADKVVFCGTAFNAAELLQEHFSDSAAQLNKVRYAPIKAVYAAFKSKDVGHAMRGFGCLYPSVESSFLAGTIWNSSIFKERCPEDEILTTSFIGGMYHPEYSNLNEEEIKERAVAQLKKDLSITGDPTFVYIAGWEKAIPQYDIHLKVARKELNTLEESTIYFTSNWTNSISLGECIQSARNLALSL